MKLFDIVSEKTCTLQPGAFVGHDGKPVVLKQAICIHEEDNGLLWKHTDYRVGGRAHAVRSRRLVISMVCTVSSGRFPGDAFSQGANAGIGRQLRIHIRVPLLLG